MVERQEEGPHHVSQVGLVLFQAVNKMNLVQEPRQTSGGGNTDLETRGFSRKTVLPSLLSVDRADGSDTTDGGLADTEEGITEDPQLPKEVQENLKFMVEGVLNSYPLHYPNNAEHMVTLLKSHPEMDPDALNNMYEAPIHAIVKKKAYSDAEKADKMATLFNLLVYSNARVDTTATYGMTALHMAANACDVDCAKVLLAFDANVNAQNAYNKTPLDLVEGPWRFFSRQDSNYALSNSALSECMDAGSLSCKARSEFIHLLKSLGAKRGRDLFKVQPSPVKRHPQCSLMRIPSASSLSSPEEAFSKKIASSFHSLREDVSSVLCSTNLEDDLGANDAIALARNLKKLKMLQKAGSRILCLDGGGMKGLTQVEVLAQIEAATGRKITELFDWIIGTSIGGIIALSIVYGKLSFRSLKQIGGKLRKGVLGSAAGGIGGNPDAAEALFKEYLPEDLTMSDVIYPRVLVTAVDKSSVNLKLRFFNNCFNDEFSTQPVWKVARYTSAAPLYLTAKDNYVDGGMLSNNAVMDAISHIQAYYLREHGCKLPISMVVSVGTGVLPDVSLGSVDILEKRSSLFALRELGTKAQNLLSLIGAAIAETQRACDSCQWYCQEMGISYFRFNIPLEKQLEMVIQDVDTIVELLLKARQYVQDSPQLRELALRFHDLAATAEKVQDML